jgi:hypothetical protein
MRLLPAAEVLRVLPFAAFAFLGACKGSQTSASGTEAKDASVDVPDAAVAAVRAVASNLARPGDRRQAGLADAARHAAFASALARGRKATGSKHYDEAIGAFGDALQAMPDSASALSERGYAELLGDHLDDAEKDLVKARGLTRDPALLGPIAYNLGLVREKRKDEGGARAAFALSNDIHPTKAAQAKLAAMDGSDSCAASAVARKLPANGLTVVDGWVATHAIVRADYAGPPHDGEAAAKRWTCVESAMAAGAAPTPSDACDKAPPWSITTIYQMFRVHEFVVAPGRGKRLLVGDLGMTGGGQCSAGGDSSTTDVETKLLGRVLVIDTKVASFLWRPVGQKNDTDPIPPDADYECREGGTDRTLAFVDLDSESALFVSSVDSASQIAVEQDPAGGPVVKLRGAGCNETYPLR